MVWYSHLFQNFLQFLVIHTVKGFGIVNKAEIDVIQNVSLSLTSFTYHNLFEIQAHCCISSLFIFSADFHCMDIPQLVNPFTSSRTFGLLLFL